MPLELHWGYIGIMEKKMETTILGSYWVLNIFMQFDPSWLDKSRTLVQHDFSQTPKDSKC